MLVISALLNQKWHQRGVSPTEQRRILESFQSNQRLENFGPTIPFCE